MTLEERIAVEKQIATKIVDDALGLGLLISVNNGGEEDEICLASDRESILENMFAADSETLSFYQKQTDKMPPFKDIGWVFLVYGNGCDVICDCLETSEMEPILKGAASLADQLEKQSA